MRSGASVVSERKTALRVLVVDDDTLARMTAAQCLTQQGHEAAMATGGAQALEMLRSGEYDLVLLDWLMPEVDGLEVLTTVKVDPELADTPIIVVSGADEADSIEKSLEAGAVGHLPKPLDPDALAAQIRECMTSVS